MLCRPRRFHSGMNRSRLIPTVIIAGAFFIFWLNYHNNEVYQEYLEYKRTHRIPDVVSDQLVIPPFKDDSVRIYIGVVTAWWNFGPRSILREAYKRYRYSNPGDVITVKFVVGHPPKSQPGSLTLLKWEQESFGDMHMIEMEENMDDGKSYEYFTSLANMYPEDIAEEDRPWDYAMKVDDDSFLNIPNLLEKLRPLTPRQNTWFGRGNKEIHYMYGPGYIFSWDMVTWLATHRENFTAFMGHMAEDYAISQMIKASGKAELLWHSLGERDYIDHPSTDGGWAREIDTDVVLVHRLKNATLLGDAVHVLFGNYSN